jgi:hypothetical protein
MQPDRPQRGSPASCVIAQQYYSATFVSLRLLFRKKKFGALLKTLLLLFFAFKKLRV